jgi:protein TonB
VPALPAPHHPLGETPPPPAAFAAPDPLPAQPAFQPAAQASAASARADEPAYPAAAPGAADRGTAYSPTRPIAAARTNAATGENTASGAGAATDADRAREDRKGPRVDASWAGNTAPAYPPAARRMGNQGEVRLDVQVGVDGSVLDVRVRTSSGSPLLDRSAIDTVRRWRFRPATVDGQPVSAWYRDWKWIFRLEG